MYYFYVPKYHVITYSILNGFNNKKGKKKVISIYLFHFKRFIKKCIWNVFCMNIYFKTN